MYLTSGSRVRRRGSSHTREPLLLTIKLARGQELCCDDLPPFVDGTINFVPEFPRRRCSLTFETQMPTREFELLLEDESARWGVALGPYQLGEYFLRDYSIDDPGPNRNYRFYLSDESVAFDEIATTRSRTYSGDLIAIVQELLLNTGITALFTGTQNANIQLSGIVIPSEKKPWTEAIKLLDKYGYEIFMSRRGTVHIRPFQEIGRALAVDLSSLALSEQKTVPRATINHLIVISNSDNGQFRGEVVDENPWSHTYYYGFHGDHSETITVRDLQSDEECEELARRLAPEYFNTHETKVFSLMQLPELDFGESFIVNQFLYRIDQMSLSLVPFRPMYLTSRGVHDETASAA